MLIFKDLLCRLVVAGLVASRAAAADCPTFDSPIVLGSVATAELTEASGLSVSHRDPNLLWVHNDSGDGPRLFALTPTGVLRGVYTLGGASALDWEDMAIGPGPVDGVSYLYAGDIGDNANARPSITIYRVPEPSPPPAGQPPALATLTGVAAIQLVYPDGPRDAETLMADVNGDLYIVTKRVSAKGRIYRAAYPQSTSTTSTLEFVGEIPWGAVNGLGGATGGDISADGRYAIVRRYSFFSPAATLWVRAPGATWAQTFAGTGCNVSMPPDLQGEAIGLATSGGPTFYTLAEGANQPIYQALANVVGDVNADGAVNDSDLGLLLNSFGKCSDAAGYLPAADLTGDRCVNDSDLGILLNNFQ